MSYSRGIGSLHDGILGAHFGEYPNGKLAEAAYVFERAGGSWTQQANLAPADGDSEDRFGVSVAVAADGTTALLGAPGDEHPNGRYAGAAYVFERAGGSWTQQAKPTPADGDEADRFGWTVAMAADGTTALVGAPEDDDPNGDEAGGGVRLRRRGWLVDPAGGPRGRRRRLARSR